MWWLVLACSTPEPPAEVPVAEPVRAGPRVVFLGDSLTAGYGLPERQAFPALVGERLAAGGTPIDVVNAGVSGDTTAGGLRRIRWVLGQEPDVVVVALGANDMLRGLPPEEARQNLVQIVRAAQESGARVLLVGMKANPTLGPEYVAAFDAIYPSVAAERDVPLLPFLLEGVAGDPALNQPDGLHPTAGGQARIADAVSSALLPLVRP
jgi:acyl-CoA thioesterase I